MSDLISRAEAIEAIEFGITYMKAINIETGEITEPFAKINDELREAVDRVKALPSAQRAGKWIDETFEPWGLVHHPFKCNLCGEHAEFASPYCPNCGARMVEDE